MQNLLGIYAARKTRLEVLRRPVQLQAVQVLKRSSARWNIEPEPISACGLVTEVMGYNLDWSQQEVIIAGRAYTC